MSTMNSYGHKNGTSTSTGSNANGATTTSSSVNTSTHNTTNVTTTINNPDILAVRNYITYTDSINHKHINNDIVLLDITHSNLIQKHVEIRLYKYNTINDLRTLIYQKSGTSINDQLLEIYDIDHITLLTTIQPNTYDTYKLGYFNILYHNMRIHCIDTNMYSINANGQLENVTLIKKFTLSDEEYSKKTKNTIRSWANEQRMIDPNFTYKKHAQQFNQLIQINYNYKHLGIPIPIGYILDPITNKIIRDPNSTILDDDNNDDDDNKEDIPLDIQYNIQSVQHIKINDRCQVMPGKRRGTVAYIGIIENNDAILVNMPINSGYWVGIVLDEPLGKNNGYIGTTQYFTTPSFDTNELLLLYGSFVRGPNIIIGNFPIRNILDSESESDNDDDDDDDNDNNENDDDNEL